MSAAETLPRLARGVPGPRVTAACLVGAGVLMTAGFAATPWEEDRSAAAYHETLAANPGRAQLAAVLLHFGYLLLAPAAVGLGTRVVALGRSGRLLTTAAVLCTLGMTTLPGLLVTDAYDLAIAEELPRATGAAVSDHVGDFPLAAILGAPAILGTVLGLVLMLLAARRAGVIPKYAVALVLAGWIVPLVAFSGTLTIVGGLIQLAGLSLAAQGVLRGGVDDAIDDAAPSPGAVQPAVS